ncbi:MAG: HPP family protein [Alphaproteobacteria bacterium]
MACHSAIEKKGSVLLPEETVENALAVLKEHEITAVPVIDGDGGFQGLFSIGILLRNLIPVSLTTSSGVQIDMKMTAVPGVAKRLAKIMPLSVAEVMDRKPARILPNEPIWEVVGQLTVKGEPLCVIDEKGKFIGLITYNSLFHELKDQMNSEDS